MIPYCKLLQGRIRRKDQKEGSEGRIRRKDQKGRIKRKP
jgi:hypothetical protein